MKGPKSAIGVFLMTAAISAATTFALGWRSIAGIVATAAGAGATVALVTRDRGDQGK